MRFSMKFNGKKNAAAQTRRDALWMLADVARKIEEGLDSGVVRDENGNTVGEWELSK